MRDESKELDELDRRVRGGVAKLRGIHVGDEVEVEVLTHLVGGRFTIAELVEKMYGLDRNEEGFSSSYTKVRRATRRLESRGLVSTRLFGKERPYRLTEYAITNLARIGGGEPQRALMPRQDLIVHATTLALSIPMLLLAKGWLVLSDPGTIVLFACFFYLLGASSSRLVQMLRRIL
jgi:hypothetical protein